MTIQPTDDRSPERREQDEQIASEPPLPPLDLPVNAEAAPMETLRSPQQKQPRAVVGVVENGLVRPIDPEVKLTEHARVIIVASDGS